MTNIGGSLFCYLTHVFYLKDLKEKNGFYVSTAQGWWNGNNFGEDKVMFWA